VEAVEEAVVEAAEVKAVKVKVKVEVPVTVMRNA
jgi:hypothetical protein